MSSSGDEEKEEVVSSGNVKGELPRREGELLVAGGRDGMVRYFVYNKGRSLKAKVDKKKGG